MATIPPMMRITCLIHSVPLHRLLLEETDREQERQPIDKAKKQKQKGNQGMAVKGQNETQPNNQPSTQPATPDRSSFLSHAEPPTQDDCSTLRRSSTLKLVFAAVTEHYKAPRATCRLKNDKPARLSWLNTVRNSSGSSYDMFSDAWNGIVRCNLCKIAQA